MPPIPHENPDTTACGTRVMCRPSRIEIAITGTAEQIEDVRVGGESVVTAEGEFYLPDAEK